MKRTHHSESADRIKSLLALRHSEDVFVTECRVGWGAYRATGYIDAWAMRKSWSKPKTEGYEIKVSRRDFLNDDKWVQYLPFCNHFYFVVPSGLVKVEEIPEEAGLIYLVKGGHKLYTKKKPPRRTIEPGALEQMYKGILMSRALITGRSTYREIGNETDRRFWERFVLAKEEDRNWGRHLRGKIRRLYEEKIEAVEEESLELQKKIAAYADIEKMIADMGVDPKSWRVKSAVSDRLTGGDVRALAKNLKSFEVVAQATLSHVRSAMGKLNSMPGDEDG